MTVAITIEYLKTLDISFSQERLVSVWNQDGVPSNANWSWWLGDRLRKMSRQDAMDHVAVAMAHVHKQNIRLPQGDAWRLWTFLSKTSDSLFYNECLALGTVLDKVS